jgi:heterodisulfide reductase subunit B
LDFALFLGCAIPYQESNYELSARNVLGILEVNLEYLPGAACCGHEIEQVDRDSYVVWAARNLCIAEEMELDIAVLCPSCFLTLKTVNDLLRKDEGRRGAVNGILEDIGMEFKGSTEVRYWVQIMLDDIGIDRVRDIISSNFTRARFTVHYGCHLLRPSDALDFDDPIRPRNIDDLVELTGGESINYLDKTMCCGMPTLTSDMKVGLGIAKSKLDNVTRARADAMITSCPICHMMFDSNQPWIETAFKTKYGIPVLHLSQLLGLAAGFSSKELGLDRNAVDTGPVLELMRT